MRALVVDASGGLSVRELTRPAPGPCQALVKMVSCGVCNGTDAKLIHGTFKNFSAYPAALGHEAVGRVVQVGERVTRFKEGDLVLLPFLYGDTDGVASGWGGYAEYGLVGDIDAYTAAGQGPGTADFDEGWCAQSVIRPSDKVDEVGASMIITFREVLSAIRRFGFAPNASLVVYGTGPVGMCFIKFAKLLGLGAVISVDIHPEKNALALAMGADAAIDSTRVDPVAYVRERFPQGVDYVVDAVGVNALLNQAMELIAYNGKICGYGISPQLGMQLDWSKAPYNWSLDFVQWPSKREEALAHNQIMAWINQGVLDPMDFISDVFDFDHILDAFDLLAQRRPDTRKIVIRYA